MAHDRLGLLLACSAAALVSVGSRAVGAPVPSPTPTLRVSPGGVAVVPAPTSTHVAGQGQSLDFGSVNPGQTVTDDVLVRNVGDTPTRVQLYVADAGPAVGGGLAFGLRTDTPKQMGAWSSLSVSIVDVPGRGSVPARLSITVPKVVQGGGYAAGIVAEQVVPPSTSGGLAQVYRFAMPVYLKVPGGAPGATPGRGSPDGTVELVDATFPRRGGKVCPKVTYRNGSQDIVNPDAQVAVHPRWVGAGHRSVYKGIGTILPDTSVTTSLPCQAVPPTGGKVDVTLSGPHVSPTKAHRSADLGGSLLPVLLALLLLVLLIAVLLWLLLRRRSREEDKRPNARAVGTSD
jgi:hypothetical protein